MRSTEDLTRVRRYLCGAIARVARGWPPEVIEELAQEGVVRLIELDKRRPFTDGVPPAYLAKMAFTLVVDEVRRGRRETLADGDGSPRWEPLSSEPNPETGSASRELGRAIRDCMERLSRNRRHAVQLMLMGHTNQEIARRLGWGAKQAENFVTRGRSDLRECLTQKGFGR